MSGLPYPPTIADVASEAGVSISTVSRFLNGSSHIAEGTVQRVRLAIQRLGYAPKAAARNLALRRTNTIGVLIEAIGTPFFADVVSGAERAAYEEGYNLLIATPGHLNDRNPSVLGPSNTDGLLIINVQLKKRNYPFIQTGYPVVCLYQPAPPSLRIPLVSIENQKGVFQAIEHLIAVHHLERIGFLRGNKGNADSQLRERGYRAALKQYGIPVNESLIGEGGYGYPTARKAVLEWHRKGILPQAIFTGNDEAALDVLLALHRMKVQVPDEVAVIGFDDTTLASFLVPPLTTIRAPISQVGREGVRKLVQMIRTGTAEPRTLLPTELVVRRSCGCTQFVEPERWPEPGAFLSVANQVSTVEFDERR